jgi:hypothetical protein
LIKAQDKFETVLEMGVSMNYAPVIGALISVLVICVFYYFLYLCLKKSDSLNVLRNISKGEIIVCEVVLASISILMSAIIGKNQFIYFWDYSREWNSAIQVSRGLYSAPLEALRDIYHTINKSDYNHFMPLLVALPMQVFGMSYASYVIITQVFYMCPALVLITVCVNKTLVISGYKPPRFSVLLLFIAFTPILYYVLLDGFMDPPVLMLVCAGLLLSLEFDYERIDLKRSALIVTTLILSVLFRRHFAYWVIGFLCSQLVAVLFQIVSKKGHRVSILKGFSLNILFGVGVGAIVFALFFRGLLTRSIFNNFSEAYIAYNVSWAGKIGQIINIYGIFILFLAIIVPAVLMIIRPRTRTIVCSLFINILVTGLLLMRVLQMNFHHHYLIIVQLILLVALSIAGITSLIDSRIVRNAVVLCFAAVCGINFLGYFSQKLSFLAFPPLFSQTKYHPKYREDIPTILRMVDDLNDMSKDGSGIYVLSSSATMNSNLLELANLPSTTRAIPQLMPTHDVDLRDGFPTDFFKARILVVCDPIQLHLADGTQEVVRYLAAQILDKKSYLGRHYDLFKEYNLQKGVVSKIYLKRTDLVQEDYQNLRSYFEKLYPGYGKMFSDQIIYEKPFFPEIPGGSLVITTSDHSLLSQFNTTSDLWRSTGKGFLVYGPYKLIKPGRYKVTFDYAYLGDMAKEAKIGFIDICLNGKTVIDSVPIKAGYSIGEITFVLKESCPLTEFRMFADVSDIVFKNMKIANLAQ